MAERPRKSLSERQADTGPVPTPSQSWLQRLSLANVKQKAVDSSEKLHSLGSSALKNRRNPLKGGRKGGRTRRYLREFFKDAPKGKLRRLVWWLHPKRQVRFWFNKDGLILGVKLSSLAFISFVLLFGAVYAYYARDLNKLRSLSSGSQSTRFYDRTGTELLYSIYGDENRTVVDFDKISPYAKYATVAIEDKNFYHHWGISPTGILRAAFSNVRGRNTQGGSTITQQYVKNALLTNERSFERKIKEAILSLELERLYSKDEILGFYLNEIPYGGTAYGIESAAHGYFSKSAGDLTIEEAAMLAAMPQAPTFYSPYGDHIEELVGRTHYIIDLMKDQGYITAEQADAAKKVDVIAKVNKNFTAYRNIKAPYLVLEVQRRLEETYGASTVATAGWKIITTVDMDLQRKAEKAITDNVSLLNRAGANNAAIVASDPQTGQVLAAAGRDFNNPEFGRYNIAFTAMRQPGSSIKPYTYATLMKGNYGPGSIFYDVATDFGGGYKPTNSDSRYNGAMTMRQALATSRNIPAVKALYMAGLENVFQTWRDVGLVSSDLSTKTQGLSFGIGAAEVKLAEHVNGYETFPTGGIHRDQALVLKITNPQGQTVQEWTDTGGKRVFDEQIAYAINNILSDKAARAPLWGRTARYLEVPGTVIAAKSGTTNARRDTWLMGYSSRIVAGLWVGNTHNTRLTVITPNLVGPIWHQFMVAAHEGKPGTDFPKVDSLKKVTLDKYTGRLPDGASTTKISDIFPSWYKPAPAKGTETFTIDIVSGKLATDCTPPAARQDTQGGGIDAEIPPSDPAYPRWSAGVKAYAASLGLKGGTGVKPTESDDVHKCSDEKPTVKVDSVTDTDSVPGGGDYTITASVHRGTFGLKQLEFKLDGQIIAGGVQEVSNSGTYSATVTGVSTGSHTASVVVTDEGYYQATDEKQFNAIASKNNGGGFGSQLALDDGAARRSRRLTFSR